MLRRNERMHDLNDVWYKPEKEPESPCVMVCIVDSKSGYCLGCFRTMKEIRDWVESSNLEKELILDKVKERRANAISTVV